MVQSGQHRRFKPRRWPLFAFLVLMIAAIAGLVYIAQPANEDVLPINERPREAISAQPTQSPEEPVRRRHVVPEGEPPAYRPEPAKAPVQPAEPEKVPA